MWLSLVETKVNAYISRVTNYPDSIKIPINIARRALKVIYSWIENEKQIISFSNIDNLKKRAFECSETNYREIQNIELSLMTALTGDRSLLFVEESYTSIPGSPVLYVLDRFVTESVISDCSSESSIDKCSLRYGLHNAQLSLMAKQAVRTPYTYLSLEEYANSPIIYKHISLHESVDRISDSIRECVLYDHEYNYLKVTMPNDECPFVGCERLEGLELVVPSVINKHQFKYLTSLKMISITSDCKTLSEDILDHLPALKYIDLSMSNVEIIPETFFRSSSLFMITIDKSGLTELPMISNLVNLVSISISNTNITTIPAGRLVNLPKLSLVLFSGNKINTIQKDAFLGLSVNHLHITDDNIIEDISSLNGVDKITINGKSL